MVAGTAEQDHEPEPAVGGVWVDAGGQGSGGHSHGAAELR